MLSYLCVLHVHIANRMNCFAYMHTHTHKSEFGLWKCVLALAALRGCVHVHAHGDNWLKHHRPDGIVMTSVGTAHPDAIGSSITWNGTWLLVLS